ncbi:MAG TPA: HAD hydrolase family protein [Puia sp.]|nr:HAD hydrolase family protein [Puia sp.]
MRYQILATDYDGTLADQGQVGEYVIEKLRQLQATGRMAVLVTGREMKDLILVFPAYKIFHYIVAENGALIHETATGKEQLLGPPPDPRFVKALEDKGVHPMSVGRVIVATWEPYEQIVLDTIKTSGVERQVIFNKGAVMILPSGINKATGLQALLHSLHLSLHNTVGIGDAENDSALLQASECAVAVSNALPALKAMADWVTVAAHGQGVIELIDGLIANDLSQIHGGLSRHNLELGKEEDGSPFSICPYRSGILISGISGSGKTTLTISIMELLISKGYQFCLIDPEGDYLELPGSVVLGSGSSLPTIEEIREFLKDPSQNLVICTLSISLADRPAFFVRLMPVLLDLRRRYGHPHWILLDEAHHLVSPSPGLSSDWLSDDLNNFILISTSPDTLEKAMLSKVGMLLTIGKNPHYPFDQFCRMMGESVPGDIPFLAEDEICVWERNSPRPPYKVRFRLPSQLQQRHKKKYAQGNMDKNSFVFTGRENKLRLKANNLMVFMQMAEGVDPDTWLYHLHRKDYTNWFRHAIHDEELARVGEEAEKIKDPRASRKHILDFIANKYTA